MVKNCDKCAQLNRTDDQFCIRCGNLLTSESSLIESFSSGVLELGRLSDRYSILKTIKSGGMGKVFMGIDKNLSKICAIKELLERFTIDQKEQENPVEMFEREAKLLASLNHPNLPRVYDYFIVKDKYYLVMDYIVGEDLLTIMDENNKDGFPEEEVVEWALQLCDVLSHLHNRQPPIIYRDLKPGNIMLKKVDNTLILIDFGIAKPTLDKKSSSLVDYITPGYSSPEQCAGKECDARSDIYSLGATIYHLLTGLRPDDFSSNSLKKLKPHVSFYMDEVVSKAMALKLKARFQTSEEFKYALSLWKDPFSILQGDSDKGLSEKDLLILQLKAKDKKVRLNAIKSLSKARERKVTVSLIKLLQDNDMLIQKTAAGALGDSGDIIALDGLLLLLRHDDLSIRMAAVESLNKIRFPEDPEIVFICLKNFFNHKDKHVRFYAFSQLSKFKYEAFYTYLIDGIQDEDSNIRRLSAIALGELGNPDALDYLRKAIKKESIFSIATKRAIQASIRKLKDIANRMLQEEIVAEKPDYEDDPVDDSSFEQSEVSISQDLNDTDEYEAEISSDILKDAKEMGNEVSSLLETSSKEALLERYRAKTIPEMTETKKPSEKLSYFTREMEIPSEEVKSVPLPGTPVIMSSKKPCIKKARPGEVKLTKSDILIPDRGMAKTQEVPKSTAGKSLLKKKLGVSKHVELPSDDEIARTQTEVIDTSAVTMAGNVMETSLEPSGGIQEIINPLEEYVHEEDIREIPVKEKKTFEDVKKKTPPRPVLNQEELEKKKEKYRALIGDDKKS